MFFSKNPKTFNKINHKTLGVPHWRLASNWRHVTVFGIWRWFGGHLALPVKALPHQKCMVVMKLMILILDMTNWQWVDIVHSILTERYSKRVAFFLATSRIKVYMMVSICKKLIPKMAHRSCFWFLRIIGNCPNCPRHFNGFVAKWG